MTLRFVPLSSLALTTALVAFAACKPAIIANGIGGGGSGSGSTSAGGAGGAGDGCWRGGVHYAVTSMWGTEQMCGGPCECDPAPIGWVCNAVECSGPGGAGGAGGAGPGGDCTYAGTTYAAGQSFPEGDGCNTCSCTANGGVACTTIACGVDSGTGDTCLYAGITYPVGQPFPEGDGCNTCTCAVNGSVSCTTIECGVDGGAPPPSDGGPTTDAGESCVYNGNVWAPGDWFPEGDDCNTCMCEANATVHCTVNSCDAGPPPPSDGGTGCFYNGVVWAPGQSFPPVGAGCDTCTCQPDGNVLCTGTTCDAGTPPPSDGGPPPSDGGTPQCFYFGQAYDPGREFPSIDGCNTCACTDSEDVICTTYTCDAG